MGRPANPTNLIVAIDAAPHHQHHVHALLVVFGWVFRSFLKFLNIIGKFLVGNKEGEFSGIYAHGSQLLIEIKLMAYQCKT